MSYLVKEMYFTLQGEGARTGAPAVFCRFSGCNLWSGREEDRAEAACRFCDTDFVGGDGAGGGRFADAAALAAAVARQWPDGISAPRSAVCTGGEPLLQLDAAAVGALRDAGFAIAIETNGTLIAPEGLDWICVSPKAGAPLRQRTGDELKLVYPQAGAPPELYAGLDFAHFYLQPLDGAQRERNAALAMAYCVRHPRWRLSLQTHKLLGFS
ncbi:MAG: 7-carboxy-7-deazaguanine synthase [Rhodospirillales bacterium]|nr:7-carboxy-7-deazaguanine synthase [Rhodospirillales bacterium]